MKREWEEEGGLCIALSEDVPTIVRVGDQELKIYAHRSGRGHYRARFIADKNVRIIGPNRVKKGWMDAVFKEESSSEG